MTSTPDISAIPTVVLFGHKVLADGPALDAVRDCIREFMIANKVSGNRLSNEAFASAQAGDDVTTFCRGRRAISRARAVRLLAAIERYPNWTAGQRVVKKADHTRAIHISDSDPEREMREIQAKRDAAAQARADWIERQRQAERDRYGFTTIDRDVMDMVA